MSASRDPLIVSRSSLGRLEQIGKGMTAKVYLAPDCHLAGQPFELVYKEYKKGCLPGGAMAGLLAIVRVRERMEEKQRLALDRRATWPLCVVEEGRQVKGVLMRLIPPEFFARRRARNGTIKRQAQELQFLLQDRAFVQRIGLEFLDVNDRLGVLTDFAYVLAMLHKVKIVYGDISLLNTIYRGGAQPGAMLVDCDAVRVAGTASPFIKQPHSPDFDPPEALANGKHLWTVQSEHTDVYKFGLVFLRVLSVGVARNSTLRKPSSISIPLPPDVRELLARTLSMDAKARPKMKEWHEILSGRRSSSTTAPPDATGPASDHSRSKRPVVLPPKRIGSWERQADGSWKKTA